jgi:hypothetical protein
VRKDVLGSLSNAWIVVANPPCQRLESDDLDPKESAVVSTTFDQFGCHFHTSSLGDYRCGVLLFFAAQQYNT